MRFGVFPDYYTTQHAYALKKAKRSGHAERSEERVVRRSAPTSAIQPARMPETPKPSAAAMPSAVEKGISGVSPDYGYTTRTHAKKGQAERNGQADRSGKGGLGGGPPTTTQHSTTTCRIKPSAVAKRSEAEKEVSRVSLDCDSSCLALCKGLGHNRPLIFARAICATQAHSPSARSNGFCVIWVVYKSNSPCAKKSRSDHTERSAKTVPFD